jgi:hypothetical protein
VRNGDLIVKVIVGREPQRDVSGPAALVEKEKSVFRRIRFRHCTLSLFPTVEPVVVLLNCSSSVLKILLACNNYLTPAQQHIGSLELI